MGSMSHGGNGASRSMFEGERGEGWACRRRWESVCQVGSGTELIWREFSSFMGFEGGEREGRRLFGGETLLRTV